MKKTIVQASLLLSFVAMTGCAGFQEEEEYAPQPPASQPQVAETHSAALGGTWAGQGCQSDGPCWTVQIALAWDDTRAWEAGEFLDAILTNLRSLGATVLSAQLGVDHAEATTIGFLPFERFGPWLRF